MGMIKKNMAVRRATLLRIWKQFQNEPLKVFILNDFKVNREYLEVLVGLELIEEVSAKYFCGTKEKTRKDVKGYKLLKGKKWGVLGIEKKEPTTVIFSKLKADSVSFDKKAKEEELAVIFSKLKNNNLKR